MNIFKRFLLISIFIGLSVFSNPAFAQSSIEEIREFESNISVSADATTNIKEKITYNFPSLRHGIIWRIPYVYSVKGFRRPTLINIERVSYYPTNNPNDRISNQFTENRSTGWLELKIGEEDVQIQGEYIFEIEYTMTYTGITYFDDHEEVYLNIIGPGWEVPIKQASATVTVPGSITDTVCYTGPDGSTASNCNISTHGNTLSINTTQSLDEFEGLTFAVSFPVGTFENTTKKQIIETIIANIGILLPIPVGIFIFGLVKRKGKNEKLTIIPNFTPEKDWNPLRSGLVYSVTQNNKYVTALLIDLAIKGYLVIKQIEKNKYELIKTDKSTEELPSYILTLYDGIFENGDTVPLSKLPNNFYMKVAQSFSQLNAHLKDTDIFSRTRESLKNKLIIISILVAFVLFVFGFAPLISNAAVGWIVGILVSALLTFIAAFTIDLRSSNLGNKEYHELLGLRRYIDTAEKYRIEFHNDPKKYNKVFEKLLPYAMIFGLEKKWAKEFEDIYTQAPEWYQGDFNTFNAYYLSRSLVLFNTAVATKSVPTNSYSSRGGYRSGGWSSGGSGFGGGGFSGGGGGGSGGGSW